MTAGRTRLLSALAIAALAAAGAGCSGTSSEASKVSTGAVELSTPPPPPIPSVPTCDDKDKDTLGPAIASYAPDRSLAPGQLPSGPTMQRILTRSPKARLIVGVDENTPFLGVRNADGQLEGLEIELVREIARAIWPADVDHIDDRIQWKAVVTEEKVPFAADGTVDMTVSVVTINCDRWKDVAFSTSYFHTPQRVLVREDSDIRSVSDLNGRKVCVTKGSTTIKKINDGPAPDAVPVEEAARTDCLVDLQEGRVDAIATHDTILFGLQRQEGAPTRVLPEDLDLEGSDYGIAMSCGNPEKDRSRCIDHHGDLSLVRFVNRVLDRMRADGSLAGLYDTWLTARGYCLDRQDQPPCPAPPVPPAVYRDEP